MPSTKKTSFQDNWLTNTLYEKCIKRVPDNIHAAHCTIFHTNFGLSNMGKGALDSAPFPIFLFPHIREKA